MPGIAELLRPAAQVPVGSEPRQASGRESHGHKITVYMSGAELLELERARLALRAHGIATDRGRIVREALAVLLADLDVGGANSLLAIRLRDGR